MLGAITQKRPVAFLAIFTAITLTFAYTSPYFSQFERWGLIAALMAGLMFSHQRLGHAAIALGALFLVWTLWSDWYLTANHGFIITYFGVFFAIVGAARADFWEHGVFFSRAILMLLMGFAFLQKISSGYYMSGNQFADLLLDGESYLFVIGMLDSGAFEDVLATTHSAFLLTGDYRTQAAGGAVPMTELSLLLVVMIYGMTYASLVLQGGVEIAIVFLDRFGIWVHRLLFLFTLTVYTLRPENVFLSLNLMMGYALTDERSKAMRLPYVIFIAYFLLTALAGYRPLWLH